MDCGTSSIGLAIQICPVVYTGYNESQLILNNVFDGSACKGTLDESVAPPVVRFTFPINATNACSSSFKVNTDYGWRGGEKSPELLLSVAKLIIVLLSDHQRTWHRDLCRLLQHPNS